MATFNKFNSFVDVTYLDLRVRAELSADIIIAPSLGITKRIAARRGMTTTLDGAPSFRETVDASEGAALRGRACLSGDLVVAVRTE